MKCVSKKLVIRCLSIMGAMLLLSACGMFSREPEGISQDFKDLPSSVMDKPTEQTLDNFPSLVSDHRAYGVGQSLTVLILEEASSVTSAASSSSKSLGVAGRLDKKTGFEVGSLDVENRSEGAGSISRQGRLLASVSATVQQVLPSGELVIYGEQKINFNNETQHIRITGRVRPEDISGDNIVLSSRIAQADITYRGDGLLGSRQQPGIITRVFNWLF
ncbi:MAG: flagellar basal body L-ring protein FlgH [Pseudomonadales bacterium]